jgi:lipoprotein signal peptidase
METAGLSVLLPGQVSSNSIGMGSSTVLFFLCDIFALPKGSIFSNIFSVGDVLIAVGAVILTQKALFTSPNPPSS